MYIGTIKNCGNYVQVKVKISEFSPLLLLSLVLAKVFRSYFHVHTLHKTDCFNGLSFSQEILETSKNKLVKTLMREKNNILSNKIVSAF